MKLIEQAPITPGVTLTRSDRGKRWVCLGMAGLVFYLEADEAMRLADRLVDAAEHIESVEKEVREEKR